MFSEQQAKQAGIFVIGGKFQRGNHILHCALMDKGRVRLVKGRMQAQATPATNRNG
jgi:hypothetical protein